MPMKKLFLLFWLGMLMHNASHAQDVQWASEILDFSSELRGEKLTREFRAMQVLGRPNKLPQFGSSVCAWSPASRGDTLGDWIKVGYRTPMQIRQVAIAESFNEGTVEIIYLYDEQGKQYKVYDHRRIDTIPALGRMLNVMIPLTPYKVKAVKLVLNTAKIRGWNQIDAIGISSSDVPVKAQINLSKSTRPAASRENLGSSVNSNGEEISPVISPDGKTLYFTRSFHPENTGRADAQDIWFSVLQADNTWTKARNIGPPINNDDQNSSFSITPDGNTMLLNNVYVPGGRMRRGLSITKRTATGWEMPQEVKIDNYYNESEYSEFSLAQNGLVLVMTIQRKDTYGSKDLYVSFLKPNSDSPNGISWTEPRNMGFIVNTAEAETSPFIASDGVSLYYSTAGLSGYGRNDIFVTKRLDDTWQNWSEPQNLGPAINTPQWDAYYTLPASGEYAYFVSAGKGYGEGDIFRVKLDPEVQPEPVVLLYGTVYNAETKQPLQAEIFYSHVGAVASASSPPPGNEMGAASAGASSAQVTMQAGTAQNSASQKSQAGSGVATLTDGLSKYSGEGYGKAGTNPVTGEYKIVLPVKRKYNLIANSDGFVSANELVDLSNYSQYQEIRKDLYLVPIKVGQKIKLSTIAFEQSKHNLLESSLPELDRLVELMRTNPNMEIQLEGHTDNQGDWNLNLKLSENRVKEVKNYLVQHGIDERRIRYKAYGSTQPVASNLNEKTRQLNRRVELVVLKK